mmetsp:Transcript_12966/g.21000  ORF Transcript_12966/g.21000 Transcript_12966/m.21000 type:complete len:143 (-) Transcript_12966:299-727(-)
MASKRLEKNSQLRSVTKGISWRVTATATTFLLTYLITGTLAFALKIGPLDFVLKLIVFYLHERVWLTVFAQSIVHKAFWKMCSWKVIALSMTISTTYYVTGEIGLALRLGPADFFAKLFLYYAHEKIWDHVSFGRTFQVKGE